jgi:hypothetical protein
MREERQIKRYQLCTLGPFDSVGIESLLGVGGSDFTFRCETEVHVLKLHRRIFGLLQAASMRQHVHAKVVSLRMQAITRITAALAAHLPRVISDQPPPLTKTEPWLLKAPPSYVLISNVLLSNRLVAERGADEIGFDRRYLTPPSELGPIQHDSLRENNGSIPTMPPPTELVSPNIYEYYETLSAMVGTAKAKHRARLKKQGKNTLMPAIHQFLSVQLRPLSEQGSVMGTREGRQALGGTLGGTLGASGVVHLDVSHNREESGTTAEVHFEAFVTSTPARSPHA